MGGLKLSYFSPVIGVCELLFGVLCTAVLEAVKERIIPPQLWL